MLQGNMGEGRLSMTLADGVSQGATERVRLPWYRRALGATARPNFVTRSVIGVAGRLRMDRLIRLIRLIRPVLRIPQRPQILRPLQLQTWFRVVPAGVRA